MPFIREVAWELAGCGFSKGQRRTTPKTADRQQRRLLIKPNGFFKFNVNCI